MVRREDVDSAEVDDESAAGDDERSGGQRVIWSRVETQARGRTPTLTHDSIALAGVTLADANGFDAVTMRRIAAELGVGTMSLYRYVSGRQDVIDLMSDRVLGELSLEGAGRDRRSVLATIARQLRAMVLRHPWMTRHVPGTRPSMGPQMMAWTEKSAAALDGDDLTIDEMMDLSGTVSSFVIGFTQSELAERNAQQRTGMSEMQWRQRMGPYLASVLERGEHPQLERIVRDAEDFPDQDEVFERRLGHVLDGLDLWVSRRQNMGVRRSF